MGLLAILFYVVVAVLVVYLLTLLVDFLVPRLNLPAIAATIIKVLIAIGVLIYVARHFGLGSGF